ncbi:hypothetical protein SSOG_06389 [Streptomyces himastatinicus ATCC 53653]|uniref:Uncharacterized protein n=1 Tax=Streptomyces himastatinicus ATCC 53653 TaxID=457427 RepID=D9W764_9ACTN|nr:hypothetical protein SSOG_06389 [Streptomyces himastatinicus ATCC 53653]
MEVRPFLAAPPTITECLGHG